MPKKTSPPSSLAWMWLAVFTPACLGGPQVEPAAPTDGSKSNDAAYVDSSVAETAVADGEAPVDAASPDGMSGDTQVGPPDAVAADTAFLPDVVLADGTETTDAATPPDTASVDGSTVDSSMTDAATAVDRWVPDTVPPDTMVVDGMLPDTASPDTATPDTAVLDALIPDSQGPVDTVIHRDTGIADTMGADRSPIPGAFPFVQDTNYDPGNHRITGFPAQITYTNTATTYPEHIGYLSNLDQPVGDCEIVADGFLSTAPAMRCTFSATYEDSANPAIGGDPHGYGQTYLGPGGVSIDPALGRVTALSIGFMWQFGSGWLEAMRYRTSRQDESLYAGVQIGGSGAKPWITHRENCEYWFDVSSLIAADSGSSFSGTLVAPQGITANSLEFHGADGEFLREEGGQLYSSTNNQVVGSVDLESGVFTLTTNVPLQAGDTLTAYYRTEPEGEWPSFTRYQNQGLWRPAAQEGYCRERPMLLSHVLYNTANWSALPAMSLTAGDDISCYCWDYYDNMCHQLEDNPDGDRVRFRIGSAVHDEPAAGVYHVGVNQPIWIELVIDTVNNVLDVYATSADGRLNDTLISHSSFCDSADNSPSRMQPNPHRYGNLVLMGEPFFALPLTTVPDDCWHQMGQWRIDGAIDGAPLTRQGPPQGFVQN